MVPKIDEKSRLRRECDFGAFWGGLGREKGRSPIVWGGHLATIFDQKRDFRKYTGALRQPGAFKGSFLLIFGHPFFDLNCWMEFSWIFGRKASQNDAKMDTKIVEISIRFQNLRFLVFCKEYSVKIVFLHDQGCHNQSKID